MTISSISLVASKWLKSPESESWYKLNHSPNLQEHKKLPIEFVHSWFSPQIVSATHSSISWQEPSFFETNPSDISTHKYTGGSNTQGYFFFSPYTGVVPKVANFLEKYVRQLFGIYGIRIRDSNKEKSWPTT